MASYVAHEREGSNGPDTIVHIVENSPEQVAYKLLEMIAFAEGKALRACAMGPKADRAYILSTYWECWRVVQGVGTEEWDDADSKELEPSAVCGPDAECSSTQPQGVLHN